jgi:hypothetical protein
LIGRLGVSLPEGPCAAAYREREKMNEADLPEVDKQTSVGIAAELGAPRDERAQSARDRSLAGTVRQAWTRFAPFLSNRAGMAGVTALLLVVYLWNALRAIDYPVYDEAAYFFRGYHLFLGDFATANLTNPNVSPLVVVYYAFWYMILHTSLLYPWVMVSSLFIMGLAAYLLLSRLLHPTLSVMLALAAVIGSAPIAPGNADYYFGTAILWMSLAIIGQRVWQRGLAVLGVVIALYARPEFIVVLLVLMAGLAIYEWRQWQQGRLSPRALLIGYAPLVLGLLVTVYLVTSLPAGADYRSSSALPWSYNDFYRVTYPSQFHGNDSYANPWIIYEKDFGPVQPRTLTNTMAALLHNPGKMNQYLTFEATRLWASFGTVASGYNWSIANPTTTVVVNITPQDTWLFGLIVLVFFALGGLSYTWLRRTGQLSKIPIKRNIPALIGISSLLALLLPLLLINPQQRFWMLFPLVLVLVGGNLMIVLTAALSLAARMLTTHPVAEQRLTRLAVIRPLALLAALLFVLLLIPQPYATTPPQPNAQTLAFLRAHVPAGSTIIGEPVISYGYYLAAEGIDLHTMSPADYLGSRFVGAFEAQPALTYALLTHAYSQGAYQQWFANWNATFPELPWTLEASNQNPDLQLYSLPPHGNGYGRVSYALWLPRAQQLHLKITNVPSFAALDFDQQLDWRSDNPGHYIRVQRWTAWQVPVEALILHPYYSGFNAYPDVSSQVEATLPASWSGRTLLFFATLAPWAAIHPNAKGTKLIFSIAQPHYSQVVQVLNYAQQRWIPIVVKLPAFSSATTLKVSIQPRVTIANDTTLFGFIGSAQG